LRSAMNVLEALHTVGLGAAKERIFVQLQAAGGARQLPGATDVQIAEHLHNADGSLRTARDVTSALHAVGLGAARNRIMAQLHAAGGARHLPGATDAQIAEHLHNADGLLRTTRDVASALHAVGLGASDKRIGTHLQNAGGAQRLPGATDAQIAEHLYNADGSLRAITDVASALHAVGLGADEKRIGIQLKTAGKAQRLPSATDAQIAEHLHHPQGSLRTTRDTLSALHDVGLGAGKDRIHAQLQAAHAQR
jgi:hypothetical protein